MAVHTAQDGRTWPAFALTVPDTARWAGPWLGVLTVLVTLACALHGLVAPEHFHEAAAGELPGWLPLAFAAGAGLGLALAVALVLVPVTRALLVVVAASHATMAGLGLGSRTIGLFGAEVEAPNLGWALATFAEVAAVVVAVVLLVWGPAVIVPTRRVRLATVAGAVLVAGLAFLTVPEVLDHTRMLAGWMWLGGRRVLGAWMWWAPFTRWG